MAKLMAMPIMDASGETFVGVRIFMRDTDCITYITHRLNTVTKSVRTWVQKFEAVEPEDGDIMQMEFWIELAGTRCFLPKHWTWQSLLAEYHKMLALPNREFIAI